MSVAAFVCVDVDYRDACVVAAAVGFTAWTDAVAAYEVTRVTAGAAPAYEPGSFYKRELPYLLDVIAVCPVPPSTIVIDGFVDLSADQPGLGAHLHDAVAGTTRAMAATAPSPTMPALTTSLATSDTTRATAHSTTPILAIIGVAKRPWRGGSAGVPVIRGTSAVPLYVTAIGIDVDEAARCVAAMHGEHRTPALLKRVDRLARDHARVPA